MQILLGPLLRDLALGVRRADCGRDEYEHSLQVDLESYLAEARGRYRRPGGCQDYDAPIETMWQGRFVSALKRGKWEFAGRTGGIRAVVILAEFDGQYILVEQHRVAVGGPCLELPAGLVGDKDRNATIESTAVAELEEEAGFTAARIERLGDFHASPGMLSESFTLVKAHEVSRVGEGGGIAGEEDIARRTGWRCIRVTWRDLADPDRLVARIAAALAGGPVAD